MNVRVRVWVWHIFFFQYTEIYFVEWHGPYILMSRWSAELYGIFVCIFIVVLKFVDNFHISLDWKMSLCVEYSKICTKPGMQIGILVEICTLRRTSAVCCHYLILDLCLMRLRHIKTYRKWLLIKFISALPSYEMIGLANNQIQAIASNQWRIYIESTSVHWNSL